MVDIPDLSLTLNSCIVNTKEKKKFKTKTQLKAHVPWHTPIIWNLLHATWIHLKAFPKDIWKPEL